MSLSSFFSKTVPVALVGALALAAATGLPSAAHASKLVALVIGHSMPGTDVLPRIYGLQENLFAYGGSEIRDARIFAGHNLSRDDLRARLAAFESSSNESEEVITVVAYIGPVAHSDKGTTYIIPADWNGEDERDLVALHDTLQMLKTKGRNYVMLDALPPVDKVIWKTTTVKPGLGRLASYGASDRLAIAYAEVPASTIVSTPLSEAFAKSLSLDRIKFVELPDLIQREAQYDIGKTTTLRQVGTLGGNTELVRLKGTEFDQRRDRCISARVEASNKTSGTIVGDIGSDGEPVMRATGRDVQASRRDFIEWFCPEAPVPVSKLHNKPAPLQPDAQQKLGRVPGAGTPNAAPRGHQVYRPPGGNVPGSGNAKSWAGNAAPVPN